MSRRIATMVIILILMLMTMAGCQGANEQDTADPADMPGQTTPTPAPTPTPPVAVTHADIPEYFTPGLSSVGIIPTGSYHIGIALDASYESDGRLDALRGICAAYEQAFGVTFVIETSPSALAQNDAVDTMISGGINFLIISPYDGAEQASVGDKCAQQGIAYITMNTRIAQTPGENGYVCTIERDPYLDGVLTGLSVVQAMTAQYGAPKGNIGELVGVVSDNASILWSMGVRRVFAAYDELNVVCSIEAGADDDTRYNAAVNLLKAYREGELDGIITCDDSLAVITLQAMADDDRDDMIGRIWSVGGTKAGLTSVWYGDFAQTIERTGQTGMIALEYALQYLEGNGQSIPPMVPAMARSFAAKTQEQKDAIAVIIADMDALGVETCFESMGSCGLFAPDADALSTAYPTPYYAQDEAYLAEFEPYTTADAIYDTGEE